jgi:hypothetical protein
VPARRDTRALARAAYLLGARHRQARRQPVGEVGRVRPLASVADPDGRRTIRAYADGRVAHQVVPALRDPEVWRHPLVAGAFDAALRRDLLAAADDLPALVDELSAAPHLPAHGDATPNNLLVDPSRPELVLIDFGFWGPAPIGFDLGQLLIGELQLGERPAAELAANEPACLAGYVRGLRDEGCTVPEPVVRRAHALQMLLFCGLSSLPLDDLGGPPTPERLRVARERAAGARFVLDLLAQSATGTPSTSARNPAAPSRPDGPLPAPGVIASGRSVTPART